MVVDYTSGEDLFPEIDVQGFPIARIANNDLYGREHTPRFNASIIRHNGKLLLSYRQYDPRQANHMTIALSELGEDFQPTGVHYPLNLKGIGSVNLFEDARLTHIGEELWLGYTEVAFLNIKQKWNRVSHISQHFCRLNDDFTCEDPITLDYGFNFTKWEKNWTWFESDGHLYCCYDPTNNTVLAVSRKSGTVLTEYVNDKCYWPYGHFRGGTSPILYEGAFLSFVHGSTTESIQDRRYYVAAYLFDPEPPFKPIAVSRVPFLYGSRKEYYCGAGNGQCVFPMGKIRGDKCFHVAMGVNDSFCAVVTIPDKSWEDDLVDWGWHKNQSNLRFYECSPMNPYPEIIGWKTDYKETKISGRGPGTGVLKTRDPVTIDYFSKNAFAREITRNQFKEILLRLERNLPQHQQYGYIEETV